jgi:hypothetical protein
MPQPISAALAELLARDGELDRIIDGRGPTFEPAVEIVQPPPTPAQPFYIEAADWDQEHREFLERERAEQERAARELVAELEGPEPPKPTPPAAKHKWRRSVA